MAETLPAEPPHVPRLSSPCFLVICRDGPEASSMRVVHLDAHLRHVEKHWTRYVTAGPLRNPGQDKLVGSVFILIAESLSDAQSLMNLDPYIACGMYESIQYFEFSNSIGQFIGGKIWASPDAIRHRAAGGPADDLSKGLSG